MIVDIKFLIACYRHVYIQSIMLTKRALSLIILTIVSLVPLSLQIPDNCTSSQFYSNTYGECRSCISNCASCANEVHCNQCNNGYYLNNQAKCQRCSVINCYLCVDDVCRVCENGYQMIRQQCVQSTFSVYFTYMLGGVFLAVIIFVGCCCFLVKKCRESQRLPIQNRVIQMHRQASSLAQIRFDETWGQSNEIQGKRQQICSFCLDGQVNLELACKHLYHIDCIKRWLIRHPDCPICKRVVSGECKLYCSMCLKCDLKFNSSLITSSLLQSKRICQKCKVINSVTK